MKLVYSLPNKLYYIQNFLDYPTYKKLHYDIFRSKNISLHSSNVLWQKELLTGVNKAPDRADLVSGYGPLQKLNILLNTNPFYKINHQIKKFIFHSMKDGSGINWHNDSPYSCGITYYINRRWNSKFGGEFLFKDQLSNGFIPLVGNSLVIVKPPLDHKVTPVMEPLVPRKTIQIFINTKEKK